MITAFFGGIRGREWQMIVHIAISERHELVQF